MISGSFFFNNSAVVNGGALDLENCAPYNGTSGLYAPWPGVIDIQVRTREACNPGLGETNSESPTRAGANPGLHKNRGLGL